jgi:hypothetical protein
MGKLLSVGIAAVVAMAGLAVATPAAQGHGNGPDSSSEIEIMRLVDTKKASHSRIVFRYADHLRGKEFNYVAYHWHLAGMRKLGPWLGGDWERPHRSHQIRQIERTVVLPKKGNRVGLNMPFDVGRWPGAYYKREDALRYTFVGLWPRSDLGEAVQTYARVMTARAGDPANYFWERNRVARVWDTSEAATHHHRLIVR